MAAGATYEPIATTTVGTATTSVTFSSISQAYTDLVAVVQHKSVATVCGLVCQVGAGSVITAASYSVTSMVGNGASVTSSRDTGRTNMSFARGNGDDNSDFQFTTINFMNYANTTTFKTAIARLSNAAQEVETNVNLLRNTTNINIITFFLTGTSLQFAVGSTFTLYGISAA
jgi:hypothetical protein